MFGGVLGFFFFFLLLQVHPDDTLHLRRCERRAGFARVSARTRSRARGMSRGGRWGFPRRLHTSAFTFPLLLCWPKPSGQKSHYRAVRLVAGGLRGPGVHVHLLLETISDIFTQSEIPQHQTLNWPTCLNNKGVEVRHCWFPTWLTSQLNTFYYFVYPLLLLFKLY